MSASALPRRVVVVGGGLAGVSACRELRSLGYAGDIVLLEAGPEPYDRPPLSKTFLTGASTHDELRLAGPDWYDNHDVELRTGSQVTRLSPALGAVELTDGTLVSGDVVLLTVGAAARTLPVPGGDLSCLHMLRTIADAERLRAELRPGARVVVVGAGLIGAEVASTAVRLGAVVTLIDPADPPLVAATGPEIARVLHDQHAAAGIEVLTAGVVGVSGARPCVVELTDGRRKRADVVVVGVGIVPRTALALSAGLTVEGGVVIDTEHRTSNPAVFAAGDSVRRRDLDGRLARGPEHWDAARRGGIAAAAGILGMAPASSDLDWFWTDRHDVHVEVFGDMCGPGQTVLRGTPGEGPLVAFRVAQGRLRGAAAIDGGIAVRAARRILDRAVQVTPAQLADLDVDLRDLARG